MKKILTIAVAALAVVSMSSCGGSRAMKNDVDTLSYALGTDFGMSLQRLINTLEDEMNMDLFYQGVEDVLNDEVVMEQQEAFAFLRNYMNIVNPQKALAKSTEYLAEIEKQEGVQKTESGLLYQIVDEGDAEVRATKPTDIVTVHYKGLNIRGEQFDSSYDRGEPAEFPLNSVIPGWSEGVMLVGKGGKVKMWLHPSMAYGERAMSPEIGPNAALYFEVEVLEVKTSADMAEEVAAEDAAEVVEE